MKIRSFLLPMLVASCAALAVFSCTKPDDGGESAGLTVTPETLSFTSEAGSQTVTVKADGQWRAEAGADWITLDPDKPVYDAWNGSLKVVVAENTETVARTATVKFSAGSVTRTVTVNQAAGEPAPEPGPDPEPQPGPEAGTVLYFNNFDKEAAVQGGSGWPYLSQSDCWKNETGAGASAVQYSYAEKLSVRNNSNSNGDYSIYEGSGVNNLFFGAEPFFCVKNIAVSGRSFTLSFGSEKYVYNGTEEQSRFNHKEFLAYVSNDGQKWVSLEYKFASGQDQSGKWDLASSTFTVPAGTETLRLYFSASVGSVYRLDDVRLVTSAETGTEVDFSKGVVIDTGNGGGNSEIGEGTGDGTAASPYNVERARYIIATGKNTSSEVYVSGIVSHISDIAATEVSEYGNASYYISDSGSMEGEFYIYHGFDLGGEKFARMDGLKVGTKVTLCGVLTNYNGTYEVTSGSRLVAKDESGAMIPNPAKSASAKWLELPATSEDDGLWFVSHSMTVGGTETRNYSYGYDTDAMLASWVAYPLSSWNKGTSVSRTDVWGYDPKMPASWQPSLAKAFSEKSPAPHGDRGHQIPSADRYANYSANAQTFYYTNMTPQINAFNAGIWGKLESSVRGWANGSDTLYVVTGCIYKDSKTVNQDNYGRDVTMPTGYFKTVLRLKGGSYSAIALLFEHKAYSYSAATVAEVLSIDELEEKTGLDFYVNLPAVVGEAKAAEIEAADPAADSFWGFKR